MRFCQNVITVPEINVHLQESTILPAGETTVLHCRYDPLIRSIPSVRWYHNGLLINDTDKYMLHPGGDMVIR